MHRLGAAQAFPGIDPRIWVSLATVTKFVVAEDGCWADVLVYYDQQVHTARVGTVYAGNGWGLYAPLEVDDEVTVGYPNGCPDNGLTIIGRSWSKADAPPQLARDNPGDLVLVVKKDANLRMAVSGGGNMVLQVADGKVLLGGPDGTVAVAFKGGKVNIGTFVIKGVGNAFTGILWYPPGVVDIAQAILLPIDPAGVNPGTADLKQAEIIDGSAHVETVK